MYVCFHPLPKEFEHDYVKAIGSMVKWCRNNIGHENENYWKKMDNGIVFARDEDALAFKLRFGL